MSPRTAARLRLTATFTALLVAAATLLLGASWLLLRGHLGRTLPDIYASPVLDRLAGQYVLAVVAVALGALGVGWLIADRTLGKLEDAVEAQRRFASNASHELRTPLTLIRAEAEVALDDPDATTGDLRAMAETVVETTERTEELLDALLVLAVATEGTRRDEPVDLARVAERAVAAARAAAPGGVRLDTRLGDARVHGDEALLERLVGNLAENALRHGRPGGQASIELSRRGGEAVLRVGNDGAPIPPELVARLTEPFERGGRGGRGGHGLGLSIVSAVAGAHGGSLRLSSPATGGLLAEVRLPVAAVTGR